MRYHDAAHVDVGSFYARKPSWGRFHRLLGYGGVVAAALAPSDQWLLGQILIAILLIWLVAWYQIVGALWRSGLVAAALLCAVRILATRYGWTA